MIDVREVNNSLINIALNVMEKYFNKFSFI